MKVSLKNRRINKSMVPKSKKKKYNKIKKSPNKQKNNPLPE